MNTATITYSAGKLLGLIRSPKRATVELEGGIIYEGIWKESGRNFEIKEEGNILTEGVGTEGKFLIRREGEVESRIIRETNLLADTESIEFLGEKKKYLNSSSFEISGVRFRFEKLGTVLMIESEEYQILTKALGLGYWIWLNKQLSE